MTDGEILMKYGNERQPMERYSRVMGYYRPFSQYNKGKQSEFKERVWFEESKVCACEMQKAV